MWRDVCKLYKWCLNILFANLMASAHSELHHLFRRFLNWSMPIPWWAACQGLAKVALWWYYIKRCWPRRPFKCWCFPAKDLPAIFGQTCQPMTDMIQHPNLQESVKRTKLNLKKLSNLLLSDPFVLSPWLVGLTFSLPPLGKQLNNKQQNLDICTSTPFYLISLSFFSTFSSVFSNSLSSSCSSSFFSCPSCSSSPIWELCTSSSRQCTEHNLCTGWHLKPAFVG